MSQAEHVNEIGIKGEDNRDIRMKGELSELLGDHGWDALLTPQKGQQSDPENQIFTPG